jgi:hypothetical protein
MGPEQHSAGVFTGLQLAMGGMVYAVCFMVLAGRWVIGDEDAIGVFLRAAAAPRPTASHTCRRSAVPTHALA